jgi:adenylate kinase
LILLLFGAPGSGKGTQSALLVEKAGFFQISTGDLLRAAIREGTALGRDAKSFMDKGELVPDSVVIGLVDEVLSTQLKGGKVSFIFDGFPRTVKQAHSLSETLKKYNLKADSAVFINVDKRGLVARLTGRRVCPTCAAVYHVANSPSKVEGICDKCGGQLIQRSDDREDVILSRLDTYEAVANSLKEFYGSFGVTKEVNGDQSVEAVYKSIVSSANIAEI